MTKQTRLKLKPEFRAKVALEAAKDQLASAPLSQKFEVTAVSISKWKSEFLANLSCNSQFLDRALLENHQVQSHLARSLRYRS